MDQGGATGAPNSGHVPAHAKISYPWPIPKRLKTGRTASGHEPAPSSRVTAPSLPVPAGTTSAAIEASTVGIPGEFTNRIVHQRGYQANAGVVTAVDELSQETINLKRSWAVPRR